MLEAFGWQEFKIGQGHFEGLGDMKWNKMIPSLIKGPRDMDPIAATK